MSEKLTFFEAWEIATGTNRRIKYKNGPWVKITTDWKFKNNTGNIYPRPTPAEQKEKIWEVEPEEIFVYGVSDRCDGRSHIFMIVPHDNGNRWTTVFEEEQQLINVFPKDKPQKFKLTLVDD